MQNILLTGAFGGLGSEIRRIFSSQGCELGPLPLAMAEAHLTALSSKELDITDQRAVDKLFASQHFDLVINTAGMTRVDDCESEEELAFAVNSDGARNLALASARTGTRMVHISTDYVFSGDAKSPYRVTDVPNPQSVYGRSKWAGESAVLTINPDSIVCRTAWLYGFEGKNFVKTIMRLGRERGCVNVVADQIGSPTCAIDLAYQTLILASSTAKGIFHCVCSGEPISWYEFAQAIIEEAHINAEVKPCTSADFKSVAKRPKYSALDISRLDSVKNVMRPWREALNDWMRQYLLLEESHA